MINELVKTDLSSTNSSDRKYFVVHKNKIFILDDTSDVSQVQAFLSNHPTSKYITGHKKHDVYDFLTTCAETAPDILVGDWRPKDSTITIWDMVDIIPTTSLNVKKASKHLGAKHVMYRSKDHTRPYDDIETKIPVRKITGKIPSKVFHGTSTIHLKSILKYGLYPNEGESKFSKSGVYHYEHVFLAAMFNTATFYAMNAVHEESKKHDNFPIVIELTVPDPDLLFPDYDADISTLEDPYYNHPHNVDNKTSMKSMGVSRETGKWGYKGRIPSHFIKWVYYYNGYEKKWHRSRPEVWRKILNKYDFETISYKLGMDSYDMDM